MASDVACLSQLCSTYKQDLRARQATLNKQTHRLRALYEMAQAMALASLHPEDLPADYQHNNMPFVGFIYKDILRAHVILIRASSRVQKVFRGHAGRRLYRRKAAARGLPPLPLPWRLAGESPAAGSPGEGYPMQARQIQPPVTGACLPPACGCLRGDARAHASEL